MDYLLNTKEVKKWLEVCLKVLNLIINGLPSKHIGSDLSLRIANVLNLIINGLPSKLTSTIKKPSSIASF